jgi:hypothetical protein
MAIKPALLRARAVALALACAACHRQPALRTAVVPVLVTVDQSAADLSPDEIAKVAPRVARIVVMPESLSISPGETYSYAMLRVLAIDSSGSALGRLRVFDTSMNPGAAVLAGGRQLRGVFPGTSELWIRFPQALWSGGGSSLPAIPVHIVVRPTATGADRPPSPNDR